MAGANLLLLGASSDIAQALAQRHLARGARIVGTYRTRQPSVDGLAAQGADLHQVDFERPADIDRFAAHLAASDFRWDALIYAAGQLAPIGPFMSLDFDAWMASVVVNGLAPLRALRALYPWRAADREPRVLLFAGGGTNGPFDNYSAYCLGKLALIKMCELLDSEVPDLTVSIVGTGWVDTKIHDQTIAAGANAGANRERTLDFMRTADARGTPMQTVLDCLDWCQSAPRAAVGGRNFSVVHDSWRDPAFLAALIADPDLCKLRRHQIHDWGAK